MKIRIGTRGSKLALAQANEVKQRLLAAHPHLVQDDITLVTITTTGDSVLDRPLSEIGGKGLFTKEIEEALLEGSIDMAVHSMKDMPGQYPAGLHVPCMLEREDPRDAFISPVAKTLQELPEGAVMGTSSFRRKVAVQAVRPDFLVKDFRGNVITRLEKLERGEVHATILAVAGLKRLGMEDKITSIIPPADMLPAVAQGAIGVECRVGDAATEKLLSAIHHQPTFEAVTAERAFLIELEGNCRTPLAAHAAHVGEGMLHIHAMLADGVGRVLKSEARCDVTEGELVAAELARELRAKLKG